MAEVEGKLGDAAAAATASGGQQVAAPGEGAPAVSPSVLVGTLTRIKDFSGTYYAQRKPWAEMFDMASFSRPADLSEATSRLRTNIAYFRINYTVLMALTSVVVILMNPSSLVVLALLAASWVYIFAVRTTPVMIGERKLSEREKFLSMCGVSFIVVFFLTSVASVLFSAAGIGAAVIAGHGAFRTPDDLFLDEAEQTGGLLSIFTAPASAQPIAAAV